MTLRFQSLLFAAMCASNLTIAPAFADETTAIRAALAKVLPDEQATAIQPSPIKNLFQVNVGSQVIFMTDDGRYLIDGAIIDLTTRKDITETARAAARRVAVAALGSDKMIQFNADKPKHTVTVFTDIDCGYCRKLHQKIGDYNAAGISVNYLFFPRSGINTPSYDKAVSVWCADDRKAAMTAAKNGETVPNKTCDNPIQQQMELGEQLNIRGTPALVLDSGELIPGFVEPKQLTKMLDQSQVSAH
ncbi:thioredoxin fold domain-containing protein [Thiospirillum jenense]|uniref:Thiol:disulfide interchange protein n=1 Tax=Thiospirillum jenense TaxID=1653858 RepID=A0A839HJX4_9GAMM|nr:thioredoxin fold domain-containing protein [Thiospirillum jenense]MBB1126222.1 thioredoxin fold domain-containing protein [Thiospirillum jenense]